MRYWLKNEAKTVKYFNHKTSDDLLLKNAQKTNRICFSNESKQSDLFVWIETKTNQINLVFDDEKQIKPHLVFDKEN